MTYFDPERLERYLYEAIHSAPRPPLRALKRYWKRERISAPGQVVCVYHVRTPRFRFVSRKSGFRYVHLLRVHPRLTYISVGGKAERVIEELDRRKLVHGEAWAFDSADRWIWAIQNAIVSMRDMELARLGRSAEEVFTLAQEEASRAELVEKILTADPAWREALTTWTGIILVRNRRHLHTVRRRMVELLTQLTRDVDGTRVSYPFRVAIGKIYDTFAWSDMPAAFDGIIAEFLPLLSLAGDPLSGGRPRTAPVERALGYIRDHYTMPVGLDEVARAVHVSGPHLSRLFHRECGRTLTDYLQILRITHARQRLAESSEPLQAIASESGFQSSEHFFRTFKKLAGVTPLQYRRANRTAP